MNSTSENKHQLTSDGKHQFIVGSKKTVISSHTFYSHEDYLRVISYNGDLLKDNLRFSNIVSMREWLDSEIYKLEMKNKLIPNHNLDVKTILIANSNIKDKINNKVSFFEIVELLDVCNVRLREVKQEVFENANYFSAIPSAGNYVNEKTIDRKVVANSVQIEDGQLAVRLSFEMHIVGGVLPIKVYKPTSFGFKA